MDFLIDLFFKMDWVNLPFVFSRIAVFILVSIGVIWILWSSLSIVMYTKNEKLPKRFKLKLAFIWSLIFYYVLFSIYLFFFFKYNGIDSFHWGDPRLYLVISSQLISIVAAIALYLFKQYQLTKELK